ncbi:MAG: hypothetical protein ACXW5U_13415 [Thermoanaerobaculia bacterium]
MALVIDRAPEEGLDLVRNHLPFGFVRSSVDAAKRGGALPVVTQPIPIHTAQLQEFLETNQSLLSHSPFTGWQYLIFRQGKPVASAELISAERGLEYGGLDEGSLARDVVDAIRFAERLREVQTSRYEIRILRVPSLWLDAVWLALQGRDLLIPIHDPPSPLKTDRTYGEQELVKALRPLAEQRAVMSDEESEADS